MKIILILFLIMFPITVFSEKDSLNNFSFTGIENSYIYQYSDLYEVQQYSPVNSFGDFADFCARCGCCMPESYDIYSGSKSPIINNNKKIYEKHVPLEFQIIPSITK